jgi:hypothetical protein
MTRCPSRATDRGRRFVNWWQRSPRVPLALKSKAHAVQAVKDAVVARRLVAAVLNTVDDTLHHTDPGGTEWKMSSIRHLKPLLGLAYLAHA